MTQNHAEHHFETIAVHAGYEPEPTTHARAVPIYQTTSYTFDNTDHAADLFGLKAFGNIYTRLMNPTNAVLEKRIADLEGGVGALAVASGQAAITTAILTLAKAGDEIVSSADLYGGTVSLFANSLKRFGITVKFVPSNDLEAWEAAITPKTKALYAETIGNPKLQIIELEKIAALGKRHGIPLVVDNTITTPYLIRPFEFGAAIVVHSATKFIGGHGTSIGGLIVDSGKFDWAASPRFSEFVDPEPAYHGLRFVEAFGNLAFILRARTLILRDTGAALSPFNAWLFTQGLETLALRIAKHSENAKKVAEFLESHPNVAWVNYPGLPSSPTYALTNRYLPHGQGAIVGFGIKGETSDQTKLAAIRLINGVKLLSHLANIGDAKSLIIHPASTTHSQLSETEQLAAGVTPDFIRLSVGIENAEDIIADLRQALAQAVGQAAYASA